MTIARTEWVDYPSNTSSQTRSGMSAANKVATFLVILLLVCVVASQCLFGARYHLPFYGVLIFSYVFGKAILAEVYRARARSVQCQLLPEAERRNIDICIAFYNEDVVLLTNCIISCLGQVNAKVRQIVVVDDGSVCRSTFDILSEIFFDFDKVNLIRYETNRGKRHALAEAVRHNRSEFCAFIDSDTTLKADALSQALHAFRTGVSVVTGNIQALNAQENWLSRLIDARYRNAFAVERAAQSATNSVLCASGVLSVYRADFLRRSMTEWTSQTFFGAPVSFGDDRRLTGMALREGASLICLEAIAYTKVPTSIRTFIKQQVRWNKSFIRESYLFLKEFGVLHAAGAMSLIELFFWVFYLVTMVNLFFWDFEVGGWSLFLMWLAQVFASGILRNLSLIVREPKLVFMAPIYSVLHVVLLTPLRLYSLATMGDMRWGTR